MPSMAGEIRDAVAALALDGVAWRRFNLVDGRSDKFWRARGAGRYVETWWGRNGTQGQTKIKELSSVRAAAQELDRLIDSKVRKGYVPEERLAVPAPRPPARPEVDPLSGRVAVYAQRDVLDRHGNVVHRRGLKQMLRPVDAAEVCTGSQDYGYGNPLTPEESLVVSLGAVDASAADVGRALEATRQGFASAAEAARGLVDAARQATERLPHVRLQPGSAVRVPLGDDDETRWGVSYQGTILTGTARQLVSRITGACTNTFQERLVVAKLRDLIARGGGRDRVVSDRGSDLGEITVSREPAAAPRNRNEIPAPIARPSTSMPEIVWRELPVSPAPPSVLTCICGWSGPEVFSTGDSSDPRRWCPRCSRVVRSAAPAPPPAPTTTAGSVALGRFAGLDDDEEEI